MVKILATYREIWSSRPAFLFAAIGAAVGFGNIWRFPAVVHEYGGGAFFLPYIFALVVIGLPLLFLEIALGQHIRRSDVIVSGYLSKGFRGVGLSSIFCGFVVVCYYVPLISWCMRVLFESFGKMRGDWDNLSGTAVSQYFFHEVIGTATLDDDMRPNRIVWGNVFYLLLTWVIVGVCISSGVKWSGRISFITMGLPIVMLLFLLVRSATLPGAAQGYHEYVGNWDWSLLVDRPDVWSAAVSQVFFSLGVAFGVMTAFGSHCESHAPAFENSIIITVSNSLFSFISGFCVFGILGYLYSTEGDFRVHSGAALLFGAYPAALASLPGGLHWVRFLFFNFILLGLDSAFAMVQAFVSMIEDSKYHGLKKPQLVAAICSVGFLCGLIYTTDAAIYFLDTMDFYVNFILLFVAFCKAFAAGWMYNIRKQIKTFGFDVIFAYLLSSFGSVVLASLVWFGVEGNTALLGLLSFIVVYGMGLYYCYEKLNCMATADNGFTLRTLGEEIVMGNVLDLRVELQGAVGYVPYAWAIAIKHIIPQVLLVLFFNLAFAKTEQGKWKFGHYGDYLGWPFQFLGVSTVLIALIMVGLGLAQASLFDGFAGKETSETSDDDFEMVDKEQATCYVNMAEGDAGVTTGNEGGPSYANMASVGDDEAAQPNEAKKPELHLV